MKKRPLLAVFWMLTGAAYVALSGRAEGFSGPRGVLIFFVAALAGMTCWNIGTILKALYRKDAPRIRTESRFLAAKFLAIGLIVAGHGVDRHRISRTMHTGDELISAIEQYRSREGHYPASLEASEFRNYQPALKDSAFRISRDQPDEFFLSFDSVAFRVCTRKNTAPEWQCAD